MIIIGLSGKKRSGKNEVAKIMSAASFHPIDEVAFADALKDEVCKACNVTRDYMEKYKDNFRLILQGWGTDFKRKLVSDTYWVEQLGRKMLSSTKQIIVITDVRFKNEAQFIKDIGGIIVRLERPFECGGCAGDGHISETDLDDWRHDHTILNIGKLEDLSHEVLVLMKKLNIKTK